MKFIFYLLVLFTIVSCNSNTNNPEESKYLRWVGDSEYDALMDDSAFQICHKESDVYQYFNFSQGMKYSGERTALRKAFEVYQNVDVPESGMVRIRFVVNCKGETGRFRLITSDFNYQPFTFDARITDQLLEITKSLDGWIPLPNLEEPKDYYQYLIFKIENGEIKEILP